MSAPREEIRAAVAAALAPLVQEVRELRRAVRVAEESSAVDAPRPMHKGTTRDKTRNQGMLTDRRTSTAAASLGLSMEGLARRAGLSISYLWRIVRGRFEPSPEILERLRAALGPAAWAYAIGETDLLPPAPVEEDRAAGQSDLVAGVR